MMIIKKINVPNIGEDELEVTEIMVKTGDNIDTNQPLIVIEGDKSSMEIPAPHSGTITKIHIHVGDKVHTGSLILLLSVQNNADTPPLNIQHDNVYQKTITVPADILAKNNKTIKKIDSNHKNQQNINITSDIIYHATPLIRHMARKLEINLSKIKGSGRKGRILKEDIQNYVHNNPTYTSPEKYEQIEPTSSYAKIDFSKFGEIKVVALNKIQKISGINLQKNWIMIPHVTQFDEADITDLETFRKQQNIEIEKKKINYKITPLVFIMKAVSKALEELPQFNSTLSQDGETLILKKYINIGIAVDTIKGLLVPVLRDINKKNIITISRELTEISKKARSNTQLTPSEMQGGSFTISSLGNIGGTAFTPIINFPEVAILGVSKSYIKPIWTGKEFIPRLILPLSLSYDHRVINGADGVRFITLISKIISDIRLLSI